MIPSCKVVIGDCREELLKLPAGSAHCCVTSPPYYGLRDYGVDGQLGLEATPAEYLLGLVEVFRAVRRVLRDDGTLWVNMGDSYAGSWGAQGRTNGGGTYNKSKISASQIDAHPKKTTNTGSIRQTGLKPKDMMGMPWALAFALRADGWYLRRDIIWHKPNPMPESCTDRPTTSHEYIFMLSKRAKKYYYDADAIAEPMAFSSEERLAQDVEAQHGSDRANGGTKTNGRMKAVGRKKPATPHRPQTDLWDHRSRHDQGCGMRNKRSVWTIPVGRFKGSHFAVFPPELIEPCVLAGCPMGGIVLDPFGGSGTTAEVAMKHGRNAVLIELNPEYSKLIDGRLARNGGQGVMAL